MCRAKPIVGLTINEEKTSLFFTFKSTSENASEWFADILPWLASPWLNAISPSLKQINESVAQVKLFSHTCCSLRTIKTSVRFALLVQPTKPHPPNLLSNRVFSTHMFESYYVPDHSRNNNGASRAHPRVVESVKTHSSPVNQVTYNSVIHGFTKTSCIIIPLSWSWSVFFYFFTKVSPGPNIKLQRFKAQATTIDNVLMVIGLKRFIKISKLITAWRLSWLQFWKRE